MRTLSALSLTPCVHDWLQETRQAHILHIFDQACNLINERGEVLSIVTPQIGDGPFNLVIEADVLFPAHLAMEAPISIRQDQLQLGGLTIHTRDAGLWSPRPDWESLHAKRATISSDGLQSCLGSWKSSNFDALPGPLPQDERAASAPLESIRPINLATYRFSAIQSTNSRSFSTALANADLASCLTAAQKLAGLGLGLTPAGDDFILGGVLAAWIIHPLEVASVLASEVTNAAAPLTTSLSAAWLRSAGRGEAGILWHAFFEALVSSEPARIQTRMDKILAVGATSGADALAGFLHTWMGWVGLASSKSP